MPFELKEMRLKKRYFVGALFAVLVGLIVLDSNLTERARARILAEYKSQTHTIPDDYKDALRAGAFQCDLHYEDFFTKHMTMICPRLNL